MTPDGINPELWQSQLKESYRAIQHNIGFVDLLAYIDMTRESKLTEAETSDNPQTAFGLLQSAQACKTIKSYIERMTSPE